MSSKPVTMGFSPCPNDTFIFYGLVHGKVENRGWRLDQPVLEDVETLNRWALEQRLDVTKLSFHAMGHVLDDYCILSAGSALGRGCGPLLVGTKAIDLQQPERLRVAIPGRYTTAALLFRLFLPGCTELVEMRFDTIMEAVQTGQVDAGVIIHESRFTYGELGLVCLQDLGQWWEESSGHPIPLGCIAARRSLGREMISKIDRAIRESVQWAFKNSLSPMVYIRQHAQELEEQVIQSHINLYVNDFSVDLGAEGREAVDYFFHRGQEVGVFPETQKKPWCP